MLRHADQPLVNALTVDVKENFQVPAFAGGGVPESASLRHRLNLGRAEGRLKQPLADFRWDRIDAVFTEVAEGAAAQPTRVL